MNRLGSRRKLSAAAEAADSVASSRKQPAEDFGSAGSIVGTAGNGSVGISEIIGAAHSQAGSSLVEGGVNASQQQQPKQKQKRTNDISYYEDD